MDISKIRKYAGEPVEFEIEGDIFYFRPLPPARLGEFTQCVSATQRSMKECGSPLAGLTTSESRMLAALLEEMVLSSDPTLMDRLIEDCIKNGVPEKKAPEQAEVLIDQFISNLYLPLLGALFQVNSLGIDKLKLSPEQKAELERLQKSLDTSPKVVNDARPN
jgi:hypothetical protein